MCVYSAIAGGEARGLKLPRGGRLTGPEAAAMLSRLPEEGQLLVAARIAVHGSKEAIETFLALRRWLWLRAADEATRQGWKLERGVPRCMWLGEVVARELMDDRTMPGREAAAMLHMSDSALRSGAWGDRLTWLRYVGGRIDADVRFRLKKQVF